MPDLQMLRIELITFARWAEDQVLEPFCIRIAPFICRILQSVSLRTHLYFIMVIASQKCYEYAQESTLLEILCKYSRVRNLVRIYQQHFTSKLPPGCDIDALAREPQIDAQRCFFNLPA